MAESYDAVLIVSFGGPEGPDDVLPFLENVVRGRNVPRERLDEVAGHYHHFGGKSPLNAANRALASALAKLLETEGPPLPVYLGNRNWHPFLADTMRQMTHAGVHRALGFVTSAYSSYSSCRQYLEDIDRARESAGPKAPTVDKLRAFFNHPSYIEATAAQLRAALAQIPSERRAAAQILYTAHSIPTVMAESSEYARQLQESASLVSQELQIADYALVYQSRSGPPQQRWLEPDILDALRRLADGGRSRDVVIAPIGFLSEHIEILWDLDTEARKLCEGLGLNMVRAKTIGADLQVVRMIRELILERTADAPRRWLGKLGPSHDVCPAACCPARLLDKRA